ncbi:Ig-like domain-containing protein [Microcoleus sp. PH2017_05_CCC_O_A]|uniref:Ig-like domain-containing protein n=1 Tax=Microcoleus sp. PH2017_05_CCC_O_A TaxID=2798816 RepID=UPI0025E34C1F|nr:Ig-like domain-containing protein [Microcoleus sp. PH2017_05_CCC_O_A]
MSGLFTNIGGIARNYVARLNSDGTVDPIFNPNPDSAVNAIAIDSSGNPYLGGNFITINGQTRYCIVKLNPTTGATDATFNPNANSSVNAIAFDSSGNLIVGGFFTNIGGQARNRIAKLNPITGAADPTFNPNADSNIEAIVLDSSGNPIVAGTFTSIGGQSRNYIAKLNPTTGATDATFNPNPNGGVWAVAVDNSGNPYVHGDFTTIGGLSRNYIAKLNPITGVADATFNPNPDNYIYEIAVDSSGNLIVGGFFTNISGQARNYIAKLDPTTGAADATFNPNTNGPINAIAFDSSGNLIVGGAFTTLGGQTRNRIAKLNPTTGAADATFNPNPNNNQVDRIAIDQGRNILYTPNANFNGVDTFQYTATDGIISTPTTVTGTPTLNAQNQNDSASTGTLISTIIANLGGTKITDPNASASQGIAITALDTANGTWQYTTNGTTWTNTPAVSATNALLLASDANTKIRFVPNAGYSGTVTNAITFAAWDRITGTNGTTANYTTDRTNNTTSSVFSTATETANITVNSFPTITSVSAATPDGTYGIGTNIGITVNFSEIVNVTGTPQLSLAGATPVASYLSGTGTNTLTFRYTVAAGDRSADLDYLSTTALSLSGGTIKNAATFDASLTLPAPAAANSLGANKAIVIDGIVPTVTSVTSTTANGSYNTTSNINVTVNFSEAVTLAGGNMTVNLDTGGTVTIAPFTGTSAVGTYTPATGQNSTDLNSTGITLATGATLRDSASNNATLTIPAGQSLADSKAIIVDTLVPNVTLTSTSPTTTNAPFLVTATFSESVTGFIASDVNLTNSTISNFTGSGTTYTFTVTPNANGAVTVDVPAARAIDTAGNNNTAAAQLTRTADTLAPTVALTSASPTTTNAPFLVTATFSETVQYN